MLGLMWVGYVYVRFWWVCHQACQNLAPFGSLLMVVARRSDIAWGDEESWGVREDRRFRKLWVRCADKIDLMKLQGGAIGELINLNATAHFCLPLFLSARLNQ